MKQTIRQPRRRTGRFAAVALVTLGLVAGACSRRDDDAGSATTQPAGTAAPGETTAPDATDAPPETTAPAPAKDPVYGGTLIVSGEAEVANPWVPAAMQCDSYCQQRARSFFDPLTVLNTDLEVEGFLIETMEHNDDYSEWTFTLRDGITFHDGTPLTAEAVVINLQASGSGLLLAAAVKDIGKNPDGTLAIEAVDELTFTVKLGFNGDLAQPLPWPNFPAAFAGQFGLIASPTWLAAVQAGTADPTMAIGTGPFIVESYAPRDRLVVKRNPNYWLTDAAGNQLPYLDEIQYRVIEDSETAGSALENGDIDIFSTSSAVVISGFRDNSDFVMTEQDEFGETNYYLINLDKPGPLQDKRVRCALSQAIDRQEMIDLTADGILQPANGLFSPGQEGYLEDNGTSIEQDVAAAAAAIAEYEAETGEQVTVKYGTTVTAINAQVAELLKGYWAEIGVDTEVVQVPQDQFITKALFGDPEFYMYGWRNHAGVNIDSQYFWWHSANAAPDGQLALNFGRVRDDIVDENLEAQRSETDPDKRREYAENVNRRMAAECYQIPGSWTLWGTPRHPKVQGLGALTLPTGSVVRDGAGFSGQFFVQTIWLDPELS